MIFYVLGALVSAAALCAGYRNWSGLTLFAGLLFVSIYADYKASEEKKKI